MQVKMKIGTILVAAASAFGTIAMSDGAAGATVDRLSQLDSALCLRTADHPAEPRAIRTRVNTERATGLDDPTLSTFLVDYPPGASALLHRKPSSGYVLVYVLSGTISATAWGAGIGIYRAGEMWVEPAFAYEISAKNPSANESARTLVVVVTGSQEPDHADDMTQAE